MSEKQNVAVTITSPRADRNAHTNLKEQDSLRKDQGSKDQDLPNSSVVQKEETQLGKEQDERVKVYDGIVCLLISCLCLDLC